MRLPYHFRVKSITLVYRLYRVFVFVLNIETLPDESQLK